MTCPKCGAEVSGFGRYTLCTECSWAADDQEEAIKHGVVTIDRLNDRIKAVMDDEELSDGETLDAVLEIVGYTKSEPTTPGGKLTAYVSRADESGAKAD